jgi:hypothetical protein
MKIGMKRIVPSVAIAIAVLIAFQVLWIFREAEMKHHDERRRIMDAVVSSARNLERLDAVEFVHETFDSVMSDLPGIHNDSVTVQMNNNGAQRIIVINGDTEISNVDIPPHPPMPPDVPQIIIEQNQVSDSNMKWESSGQRTVIMRRSDRVKSAMQDMIMSYVFNTDSVATRFTKAKTDSIVSENLRMRGIDYAFDASLTQPPMRPPLPMVRRCLNRNRCRSARNCVLRFIPITDRCGFLYCRRFCFRYSSPAEFCCCLC